LYATSPIFQAHPNHDEPHRFGLALQRIRVAGGHRQLSYAASCKALALKDLDRAFCNEKPLLYRSTAAAAMRFANSGAE
jgi:hypothetical protein